jgi:ABC-type lipoprotein export system ATPase subunit
MTASAVLQAFPVRDDAPALVTTEEVGVVHGRGEAAVQALDAITCSVAPGAQIALVGASGSGKSTLLHVLAGLQPPSSGAVSWPGLGATPAGRPDLVGVVFQSPSLLPPLDAVENVELPLLLLGADPVQARARAREALDRLGLMPLADQLPEELSGGQAQRVALARVLVAGPRLVLADEPTGQLDHATGAHVLDVLQATVAQLGAALVVSTHDDEVACRLATRWEIADGRLRDRGGLS